MESIRFKVVRMIEDFGNFSFLQIIDDFQDWIFFQTSMVRDFDKS